MNKRPKRKIIPSSLLKEYIVLSENEKNDSNPIQEESHVETSKQAKSACINSSILKSNAKSRCAKSENSNLAKSVVLKENKLDNPSGIKSTDFEDEQKDPSKLKHKDGGKFLCEECGKSLSSLQSFAEHSNIHKNIKPFKCEICGRCSRQWSVHSRHLLTHDKNANIYTCTICSKTFRSKVYLKFHIRKHLDTEVKPHTCSDCSKGFTTRRDLNRHVICHSSIYSFECSHCQKKFKFKHNLTAHLKAHMGKQSWKCHVCKASFPQNSLLKAHQRDHKEIIQNVELAKIDNRTINVLTFPLDRRKVAQAQEVSLPKNLSLDDGEELKKSKLSLCLNDVAFPLSVVANSFGTGKYITVKIIDPQTKKSQLSAQDKGPIKAFLTGAETDLIECLEDDNTGQLSSSNVSLTSSSKVGNEVMHKSDTIGSSNPIEEIHTAFMSIEYKLKMSQADEEVLSIITNIASDIKKIDPPLPFEICKDLNKITSYMQTYLTENELTEFDEKSNKFQQAAASISTNEQSIKNEISYGDIVPVSNKPKVTVPFAPKNRYKYMKLEKNSKGKKDNSNMSSNITASSNVAIKETCNQNFEKVPSKICNGEGVKSLKSSLPNLLWRKIHGHYQDLSVILQEHFRNKMKLSNEPHIISQESAITASSVIKLAKKASSMMRFLYRGKCYFSDMQMVDTQKSQVWSQMEYGSPLFAGGRVYLDSVQNRIHKTS